MSAGVATEALQSLIARIRPARRADADTVRTHIDCLTKPPGSLGRLEGLALRLALIYGDPPPPLLRRVVFVLAADHGVAARGVSAYPSEVTEQMCRNFAAGGAAINAIAGCVGSDVVVVDMGVDADLSSERGIVDRKIRRGTRDLAAEPALTRAEARDAILAGAALVEERAAGVDLVGLGEMGIGNTTAATAMSAALTGRPLEQLLGPGTGVSGARLEQKRQAVEAALKRCGDRRAPIDILAEMGGLEIAGLVGIILGSAACGRAVVSDGFIAGAATLAAVRICPDARDYVFPSHRSSEPGHAVILGALGFEPLMELGLHLGEGTGACLAFPLLDAAAAILREMATFSSAGVSDSDV